MMMNKNGRIYKVIVELANIYFIYFMFISKRVNFGLVNIHEILFMRD